MSYKSRYIRYFLLPFSALFIFNACKKSETTAASTVTPQQVFDDFVNVLAKPNYTDFEQKAQALNDAVIQLNINTNDENLKAAQNQWFTTRDAWEQAEGWLFGPVEETTAQQSSFDAQMDTWPMNKTQLDSLLASQTTSFTNQNVALFDNALKGFHPLEYLLFGIGGIKKAANFTQKEKQYMLALSANLYNNIKNLNIAFNTYTPNLLNIAKRTSNFKNEYDALNTIASAMVAICEEVADGKMQVPIDEYKNNADDPEKYEESQFAYSTLRDFKNNMIGVRNVYLGQYTNDGNGISELVASVNKSLDSKIKQQIEAAIAAVQNIQATSYGNAVKNQLTQIQNTQKIIRTLKATLETELIKGFIEVNYAKDAK